MTMKPTSIPKTLVLAALLGASLPPVAAAQNGPRPTTSTRPAPAPAPRPVGTTGTTPTQAPAASAPATSTPAPAPTRAAVAGVRSWSEQEYRLGPGDKIRIEVYREPQLSQALQVRPDGKITLPLIGDVQAAGATSLELRDALTTSLKEYVTNPVVTVIVQEAIANQIDVVGEVSTPGPQVLQGPVTILQAISRAGGLKEFAKAGDIRVLRKTGRGTQTLEANYKEALKGRAEPMVLQPGDTVIVP